MKAFEFSENYSDFKDFKTRRSEVFEEIFDEVSNYISILEDEGKGKLNISENELKEKLSEYLDGNEDDWDYEDEEAKYNFLEWLSEQEFEDESEVNK